MQVTRKGQIYFYLTSAMFQRQNGVHKFTKFKNAYINIRSNLELSTTTY